MDKSTISNNGQTVKEKINAMLPSFSKGQKKLAEYILENYDTAAFLTAAKLGQKAGVSESTAVRFAMMLGYEGYPQFQEAMAVFLKKRLGSVEKIEAAAGYRAVQGSFVCAQRGYREDKTYHGDY